MITAGIDCGAKNTKSVILKAGRILGKGTAPSGFDPAKAIEASMAQALVAAGITKEKMIRIAGTGSGKDSITMADDTVTDITAIARAAVFYNPNARTVADIGAEEARAARLDAGGYPVDFAINEKCAAGTGAFIEAMSRALEVTLDEMGSLCLQSDRQIPLNAQCVIFAESEVVGLIHSKTPKPDISKAIHDAIARRIVSMIRRIGLNEEIVLIGGVGRNPGFVSSLKRELGIGHLAVPIEPEFGAAVGAALVAAASSG